MSEIEYFRREFDYLVSEGEKFADKYEIGRELRFSQEGSKDPFVERLLEAFAFLSGRIHERLDADMPEFSMGLLEQMLPHVLRPLSVLLYFESKTHQWYCYSGCFRT